VRVAVVQMRSTDDPWWNLQQIYDFVEMAKRERCDLICFPENVFYRGPSFRGAQERENFCLGLEDNSRIRRDSDFSKELYELIEGCPIAMSLGSVRQFSKNFPEKFQNSHWYVNRNKTVVSYSKIHLFNFGESYQESDEIENGSLARVVDSELFRFGLSICYDLRFPELYRWMTLALGANAFLVPAAFTKQTGEAHWEVLLRSRAIENQSFVLASAQWGEHWGVRGQLLGCHGCSMIVDPWGRILQKSGADGDDLLISDLDFDEVRKVRATLPALQHNVFRIIQPSQEGR